MRSSLTSPTPSYFRSWRLTPRWCDCFPTTSARIKNSTGKPGIYTPVHMIVMSRKLDRRRPDLAAKFYNAFEQAKQIAYDDILSDRGGFSVVYLREKLKEQNA